MAVMLCVLVVGVLLRVRKEIKCTERCSQCYIVGLIYLVGGRGRVDKREEGKKGGKDVKED